jgi:hypothetical protein
MPTLKVNIEGKLAASDSGQGGPAAQGGQGWCARAGQAGGAQGASYLS